MPKTHASAKIIPFPGQNGASGPGQTVPICEDVPVVAWPPMALDSFRVPPDEPMQWLEEALVAAKVREMAFCRALAQLPLTSLRPEMHEGPLLQFRKVGNRLTLALELLRLGQVGPSEVEALVPGLRRAWALLRDLRQTLLEDLEPRARTLVQSQETRSTIGPLDVERELQERSHRRTLSGDPFSRKLAVPGHYPLDLPERPELELRRRRERRLAHDFRPINVDMDLATWLEELPREWLEGIARGAGLPLIDDRWEQERAVHRRLCSPAGLMSILRKLMRLERHILARIMTQGGVTRYDELVLRYGGDDETAWHWAEEVPTTPLERLRRTGLLYVGQSQVGRRSHRVAVIPIDLREPLARVLNTSAR